MAFSQDTIAALATPVGTSAIAVVRASGPRCGALVREIFSEEPRPRAARHADYRNRRGELVDDVLFTFFAAPNSFTGEDTLEISSHGNPFIAQKILEDLFTRDCRPAEAGEFSKRAFLNGRLDLSQAEAVMDLIHARSERALAMANQQLRGALGRRMNALIHLLVKILANLEAYIDFPEDDLPAEDQQKLLAEIRKLRAETGRLLATNHYGTMLRDGIRTVILGEPNAGKSSLLNRLLGRDRALVSPEPGTTRDYLEERILVGPHALRLVDTAGLNSASTGLERRGIDKTLEQAAEADLVLWVLDATRAKPTLPPSIATRLHAGNTVAVLNKMDLPGARSDLDGPPLPAVQVSALTGAGLDALQATIVSLADAFQVQQGDDVVAINVRHSRALTDAQERLEQAERALASGAAPELVASELRGALTAYGEIAGRIDNERVLDELFATFCIGK